MRKLRFIFLLAGLVLIGGLWLFFGRQQQSQAPGGGPHTTGHGQHAGAGGAPGGGGRRRGAQGPGNAVPVVAGTVQKKDVPIYLDGIGTVQAFNMVTVRARVDGQIEKIAFQEGQDVKKGDLLAVIDPRPYQAALDQAIGKKAQDVAQLGNARTVFQRDSELLAKKVLDQQTYDTQKYQVDQFEAAIKADDANIGSAQVQLNYTQITAPIDGRVGVRLVDVGNIVHASDTTGIVVITQLKPISVMFTLPQQQLPQVNEEAAKGTLKVLAVDRDNTKPLGEGSLAVVDNQIDPQTGTVKMKGTFPNDQLTLWPGQFVNARLLVKVQKDGLVVPASVVQRGPQGTFAYVINQKKTAEMRAIKVGPVEGGLALIEDGLKEGEQVVVDGYYKLQPGSQVDITNPQQGEQPTIGKEQPRAAAPMSASASVSAS
jgi:membrane fusion protein, multidrug efflux system